MNRQDQRQPMQQKNVQRKPSVPRFQKPQLNLPLVIPGKSAAPTPIRSVHNSSVSTASKAVHWNPRIAETYAPSISDDEVFEDENLEGVLERNLPGDKVFLREDLDLKDYLRRSYSIGDAVVTWSQNK
uniref:Uncharacterized protein n=1 Tax=Panagrolaimus sp. JU765 TaxID=591449 RepID=A0AC34Q9A9_9BILA